ncbi:Lipase 2 precursor [Corynebacterium capitovis DSM 44611]|uniref:SGNH/GDSL hydrolase family protein n=1 Tax=Corynebacterium capitovis TaxID=131081 RepID=UPI00035EE917|nr:SGNH/GDSL hydrolase family protein [Corynebacterium capitovis]WKD58326.1 Lipase 2 precursor [Corynebacterium capitovis DSM 44611]
MRKLLSVVAATATCTLTACYAEPVQDVGTVTSVVPPVVVATDPNVETATAMATPEPTKDPSSIKRYVALGDSYASMGSAVGQAADPSFCARSADNYPHELAGLFDHAITLVDATCQGSTTANIPGPRDSHELSTPLHPQLDYVNRRTDLITLSIGGNDMDFAGIAHCVQDAIGGAQRDCVKEFAAPTAVSLAELPGRINEVYARIHDAAPRATIVATGYTPLVSVEQSCAATDRLSADAVEWVVWLTAVINNIVKQTAEANGALYVLPDGVERHTTCAEVSERWVDAEGKATGSYPAHPTPAGQRAMAEAVARALDA